MANHIKALQRNGVRYFKNPVLKASIKYTKKANKCSIDEHSILIECYQGSIITDALDTIFDTLKNFQNHSLYTLYVTVSKHHKKEIKQAIGHLGFLNVVFVEYHSMQYVEVLRKSKFIFTNFTLPTYFQKSNDQVITYYYEDIAFFKVGRHHVNQPINRYDFQRTMLLSDYLVVDDQETMDKIVESFDLGSIYLGSYVIANNDDQYAYFIEHLRYDTKVFYHFILDWKQASINHRLKEYTKEVVSTLRQFDEELFLEETLFVVCDRVFSGKIDFRQFKHIKPLYIYRDYSEEIAKSDGILCDYTIDGMKYHHEKREVFMYPILHDESNYYTNVKDLPFRVMGDVQEAIRELRSKDYHVVKPYRMNRKASIKFNAIVEHILFKRELGDSFIKDNLLELKKRKNVLLFAGDIKNQNSANALLEQLKYSNTKRYHYFILFYTKHGKNNSTFFNELSDDVTLLPIYGRKTTTILEGFAQYFYFRYNYNKKWISHLLDRCYTREINRISRGIKFDYAIHFGGCEKYMIWLLGKLEASRTIILHNYDSMSTLNKKKIHPLSFNYACSNYEVVSIVEDDSKRGLDHYLSKEPVSYLLKNNKPQPVKSNYSNEQFIDLIKEDSSCYAIVGCNDVEELELMITSNQGCYLLVYVDDVSVYSYLSQLHLENDKIIVLFDPSYTCLHLDIADAVILNDTKKIAYDYIVGAMKYQVPMFTFNHTKSMNLLKRGLGTVIPKRVRFDKVVRFVSKKKKIQIDKRRVSLSLQIIEQIYLLCGRFCNSIIKKFVKLFILLLKKTAPFYSAIIPKNDSMILYISFHGRGYSDNPKALHEYMIKNSDYAKYKHVWAIKGVQKKSIKIEGATVIRYGGIRYLFALVRSKYWISNCKLPEYVYKHKNQVYLQTWHGTPLKRLAYDIEVGKDATFYRSEMSYKAMTNTYKTDVEKYDYMISPSQFTTEVFQSAFRINVERLIETGYPRNDCLSLTNVKDVEQLKKEYGIADHKKIILYAPTWRDNSYSNRGYTFNLEVHFDLWQEILGDEYVVLFKPHYLIINNFNLDNYKDFVYYIDPNIDISSLYTISDVLVTDYSSVFFDYSILNRPTYFYMYDLDCYQSELRGFYIDIYKDLPGDIYDKETAMLTAIKKGQFDSSRLQAFNERFNNKEDGNACKRVLDIVFKHDC